MESKFRVVTTGGTIDKAYAATEDHHGRNYEIGEPAWHAIAARAKLPYVPIVREACRIDSLDMTSDHRDVIEVSVAAAMEDRVIVTHGTDSIHITAERLSTIKGKTIVLTGAMQPEKFKESDADFYVGVAVGAVLSLPPGVYIALNGDVVPWEEFEPS